MSKAKFAAMLESSIEFESGSYFVLRVSNAYEVRKNKLTHSIHDSSYAKTADGLSIAIARCRYLAKRETAKS